MNRTLRENAGALPAGQARIAVMWAYEAVGIPAGQPAAKWRMPADCGTQVLSCLALNEGVRDAACAGHEDWTNGSQACVVAVLVGNRLAAEARPWSCLTAAWTEAQGHRGVAAPVW
jgi:hypothetical protein